MNIVGRTLLYDPQGEARWFVSVLIIMASSICMATTSPHDFLNYNNSQLTNLIIPIAGTIIALALPAAQLAQSATKELYKAMERKAQEDASALEIATVIQQRVADYNLVLSPAKLIVLFSIISFSTGIVGILVDPQHFPHYAAFSTADFITSSSLMFLIASILWFIPMLIAAFDLSIVRGIIDTLSAPDPPEEGQGGSAVTENNPDQPKDDA